MSADDATDEELIAGMSTGDAGAFTAFYDRHAPRILGLLLRILGERSVADDVLQDVFLQVWKSAADYSTNRGTPSVWLGMLARSRAVDRLRRDSRRQHAALDLDLPFFSDPGDEVVRTESAERVRMAMKRLAPDQATALTLSFFGGLTHEEVAARLAIPLGTAKTRIRTAIGRLREMLGGEKEVGA